MASSSCSAEVFTALSLPSINIQNVYATPVTGYPIETRATMPNHGHYPAGTIDFCNVTIEYTRADDDDDYAILFEAWLPDHESWNQRLIASGGSGFRAGRFSGTYAVMSGHVDEGYASFTTDGGAPAASFAQLALKEEGVLDHLRLTNWATAAIGDMSVIGKAAVEEYYGQPAAYSYFSGCSQGGRQGYQFAQTFPDAFDGIAAAAPVIEMTNVAYFILWPQFLMNQAKSWPLGCVIDSITALAVAKCDAKDGIEDGIIADPALCESLDPFDFVGEAAVVCKNPDVKITEMAALVVNATWTGLPTRDGGSIIYPGFFPGTDLTGKKTGYAVATTSCYEESDAPAGGCKGVPNELGRAAAQIMSAKDPNFDYTQLTLEQLYSGQEEGIEFFGEPAQAFNPDLSAFRNRGGKMITYHGLADQVISPGTTRKYHDLVSQRFDDLDDFYRYFEIPGLAHCAGPQHPDSTFNDLKRWVEEGIAPETLGYKQSDKEGKVGERVACLYPKKAKYDSCCGDPYSAKCFKCK